MRRASSLNRLHFQLPPPPPPPLELRESRRNLAATLRLQHDATATKTKDAAGGGPCPTYEEILPPPPPKEYEDRQQQATPPQPGDRRVERLKNSSFTDRSRSYSADRLVSTAGARRDGVIEGTIPRQWSLNVS